MSNEGFDVAMAKSSFFLERSSNGELMLKKEHCYYYQCQLQTVATARPYCVHATCCIPAKVESMTQNRQNAVIQGKRCTL